jgi:hypothetical protein
VIALTILCLLTNPVIAVVQQPAASESIPVTGSGTASQASPPEDDTDESANETNESVPGEISGNVSGEGAFKFLAANDPDPERNNSTVEVYDVGSRSFEIRRNLTTSNISYDLRPYELDRHEMTYNESQVQANQTDGYRTTLNREVLVATEDKWVPLSDDRVAEIRIQRNFSRNGTADNTILGNASWEIDAYATTIDTYVPVRNAVVFIKVFRFGDLVIPFRLIIPGTGEANVGEYRSYQDRVNNASRAIVISGGADTTADLNQSTYPTNETVAWFVKGTTENAIDGPGEVAFERETVVEESDNGSQLVTTTEGGDEDANQSLEDSSGETNLDGDGSNTSETTEPSGNLSDDESEIKITAGNQTVNATEDINLSEVESVSETGVVAENLTNDSEAGPMTVDDAWDEDTYRVIGDHWGGIARITPGAFYNGSFMVRDGPTQVYAPSDYRIGVPPDTIETYVDSSGNETVSATIYETWEVANLSTDKSVRIGTAEGEPNETSGVYDFENVSGETVEMESTVSIKLEHTYGISCSESSDGEDSEDSESGTGSCESALPEDVDVPEELDSSSREVVENVTITHTVTQSHPLLTHDPEELSVEVFVLNKSINEMYVTIDGEQTMESQAISTITVENNGRNFTLQSPWRFYPIALHRGMNTTNGAKAVQYNTSFAANASAGIPEARESTDEERPSPAEIINSGETSTEIRRIEGEEVPNMYRDYAEPEGWAVQNRSLEILAINKNTTQNVSNEALPESVVRNDAETPLYDTWGGFATNVSDENLSETNATAVDIFGQPIEAEVTERNYEETDIELDVTNDTVDIRLLAGGEPVAGEEVRVYGAEEEVVTTDGDGYATVTAERYVVRATYEGTDYQEEVDTYYESSSKSIAVPFYFAKPVYSVDEYLGIMINNVTLVIEWVGLGIILLFMYRYTVWGGTDRQ